MPRTPKNVNFCTFCECQYLQDGDCTVEECIYNNKLVDFWIWHRLHAIVEPVSLVEFNEHKTLFETQVTAFNEHKALFETQLEIFNAHTHDYRKVKQLGADGVGDYSSPARVDLVDDDEVNITDANKTAAVGLTVATEPTSPPIQE